MSLIEAINHAREVRQRLRNPVNAVKDTGINLRPIPSPKLSPCPQRLEDHDAFGPVVIEPPEPSEDDLAFGPKIYTDPIVVHFDTIMRVVANFYGVTMIELRSPRRNQYYTRARHVACWLARQHTQLSLPSIGRRFGGRDHTTILHAYRSIDKQYESNPILRAEIAAIRSQF